MEDCIFCKIVRGEIPSKKIFENENVIAFLDIQPESKGHTLVVPKSHSANIYEISKDDLNVVMEVVKLLSVRLKEKLNTEGLNIKQNNGRIAGQTVDHIHFHLIPKYSSESEYDIDEVLNMLTSN